MVLGALTILTVMLTEFQSESSADLSSALYTRDSIKAEYAARSAVNLSRLLIASEPTIRKALAPLFIMMRRGPPQIPVWEFAEPVLGAFNDEIGGEQFTALSGVNLAEGRNLGFEGANFSVQVVDEDSKINVNQPARGDLFSQNRLAAQLLGLISPPQDDPLFQGRDADGEFTDRSVLCSSIIDWTDPDQDAFVCDLSNTTAQQSAAEDSFYSLLDHPYSRKNAAFDSLEELRMVRGVGDDFWETFVDPRPESPHKRNLTVWGQGAINVNTANPQTILAVVCSAAPSYELCLNAEAQIQFLSTMALVRGASAGAPLFGSPKVFINALKGKGMFGTLLGALGIKPLQEGQLLSERELLKVITTESKVFSVYATGRVSSGKRETAVRVHAVVDFRGAPTPEEMLKQAEERLKNLTNPSAATEPEDDELPEGATEDAISGAFQPDPGGNILYYRVN